ncbi:ABC transporter ATP-binding protein [Salmonella enterica]|nr:ABC transporter ATP-binding protein [Salmonella enterica subsp. enterica serovar Panama]EGX9180294.1 ABC transporter ATP-binding protein [Salmonella enterica]EGZ6497052.1 ABC transporter ATP-binding protein [Salmonella enterica]
MSTIRILLSMLSKKSKLKLALILSLTVIASVLSVLTPVIIAKLTGLLQEDKYSQFSLAYYLGVAYVIIISSQKLFGFFSAYLQNILRVECISSISLKYLSSLYENPSVIKRDENSGDVTQRLNQASNDVYIIFSCLSSAILPAFIQLSVSLGIIFSTKDWVVGTLFLVYSIFFVLVSFIYTRRLINARGLLIDSSRKTYSLITDSVRNLSVVRINNSFDYFYNRFEKHLKKDISSQKTYWKTDFISVALLGGLQLAFFLVTFLYTLQRALNNEIPLSHFILISSYILLLTSPLEGLGQTIVSFIQSSNAFKDFICYSSINRSNSMVKKESDIRSYDLTVNGLIYHATNSGFKLGPININFPKGSFTTITGKSGSGKSTLLKLLFREFLPDEGQILLGGTELNSVGNDKFYDSISYITQDDYVFMDSLRFNLKIANPEASDEQLLQALRKVELDNYLTSEEVNALDMKLDDFGSNVSGGQRQRLSLARLFLRNPEIILLDEVTSSVDLETEEHILDTIRTFFPESTVIYVTHRTLSTSYSDQVLVMKAGKICLESSTLI